MTLPAALGGPAAFPEPLPFARPTIEEPGRILGDIEAALASGMVTNSSLVRELETKAAAEFEVEHCVAVASCTLGLMLVIQAIDPQGPVLVPSFTFAASAHAVAWNGREILFADCDPDTWLLRPEDVYGDPALIMGVHISGVPVDYAGLAEVATDVGADLMFDAAHGAGSRVLVDGQLRPLGGFGRAEVFSLTPTKVLSGAEGGLITTNDAELAERLRLARDYGNPGDYDMRFAGLNARLSELHAAVALASLDHLETRVDHRNAVADRYRLLMAEIPGVGFQSVPDGSRSSYKDFTILINEAEFGASRDTVVAALAAEGVPTRPYYSPPVHRQTAYAHVVSPELPNTDRLASQVISLPMWSHLPLEHAEKVAAAVSAIQQNADAVSAAVQSG
ncbi:MAG: DegT/DnrJ/EryC1/StrS family aminotransferase [Acidimicrobiia bacterium]|nr:DegT/DnrJ/EryC1/StrS family aminotransferase [Acidimicrobiia bacterium]